MRGITNEMQGKGKQGGKEKHEQNQAINDESHQQTWIN